MPVVPQYDGPQIRSEPFRAPQMRTPDVSSGLEAISHGLNTAAAVAADINEKQQTILAQDAEYKFRNDFAKFKAETQKEFTGEKAPQWTATVQKWFKDNEQKYGQELSGFAKAQIASRLRGFAGSALADATGWSVEEQDRHATSVFSAAVDGRINDGVSSNKPEEAQKDVNAMIDQQALAKHLSPEETAMVKRKASTQLWTAQILQQVETDPEGADAVFKAKVKDGVIDTEAQNHLRDVIKVAGDKKFARDFALNVQSKTYEQQVAEAQAIKDPDRQRLALNEVDSNETRRLHMEAHAEHQAQQIAVDLFTRGGTPSTAQLMAMDPLARMSLERAISARDKNGGQPPKFTDMKLYMAMMRTPIDVVPQWNDALLKHAEQVMTPTHFNQVLDKWKASQEPVPGESRESIISTAVKLAGVEPTASKQWHADEFNKQSEDYGKFVAALNKAVDDKRAKAPSGKLSSEEIRDIVMPMALDRLHKAQKWGGHEEETTPRILMTDEEFNNATITIGGEEYPISTVDESGNRQLSAWLRPQYENGIRTYLKARGMPMSLENRFKAYQAIRQKMLEKTPQQ